MDSLILLDKAIQELRAREPFWNICFPCECKGVCCRRADITICEKEWSAIHSYVRGLPDSEKALLRRNIRRGSMCVFQTESKCLIHDVRPENCRYTPYQYNVVDGRLNYSMVRVDSLSSECTFDSVSMPLSAENCEKLSECKFALLPNHERKTWYLSLNWLVRNSPALAPGNERLLSDWLRDFPGLLDEPAHN